MTQFNKLHLSSSPHFKSSWTTQKIMLTVLICMLPECAAGVYFFGIRALVTILTSVASCILFEALFQIITKQEVVIKNLSAAVTGVLLALVLPSTTPVWMTVLGAFVAVVIAKGLFGGIGSNVFNPALTGRAVLFISFPAVLGASWLNPQADINKWSFAQTSLKNLDAVSSATVLSQIKAGTFQANKEIWITYLFGNRSGCIGETAIVLILLSFLILVAGKIIDWRAPLGMVFTAALATFLESLVKNHQLVLAASDVITCLLTGGLLFGATFMITDYATAPVTKWGRFIFGCGAGLITFLIRSFGNYPEGVMFSILIMNAIAPFLNNITGRKYGYGKKGHRRPQPRKIVQDFDVKNAKEVTLKEEAAK